MCIICVDLDNGILDPWEAAKNRSEMTEELSLDHLKILDIKISQALLDYLNSLPRVGISPEDQGGTPPLPGTGGSD